MGKLGTKTSDLKKPYRCLFCGTGFLYKETLKRHRVKNVCGFITPQFIDEETVKTQKEKEIAKTQKERSYKCCMCEKDFLSEKWYLKHMSNKCPVLPSNKGFQEKSLTQVECSSLDNNSDTYHTNELNQYPKSRVRKKMSIIFSDKACSKNDKEMCIVCRKEFPSKQELEMHMREHLPTETIAPLVHTEKRNQDFKGSKRRCKFCRKMFKNSRALKIHMVKHKKDLTCSICDETFGKLFILMRHMKTHTNQAITSDTCEKADIQSAQLLSLNSSDKERPYTCTICKKGFLKLCGLASHARVHGGWEMLSLDKDSEEIDESARNDTAVYITEEPDREKNGIESDGHFQIMADPLDHIPQFSDYNIALQRSDGIADNEITDAIEGSSTVQSDVEALPLQNTDDYLLPHPLTAVQFTADLYSDISLNNRHVTESTRYSYSNQNSHIDAHASLSFGYSFSRNITDEVCSSNHSEPSDMCQHNEIVQNKRKEITVYIMENDAVAEINENDDDDDDNDADGDDDTETTYEESSDPLQKDDVNEGSGSEYRCSECEETFLSCTALDDHTMSCHNVLKKSTLRKQHTVELGNLPKYKCSVCWTDFLFHSDLIEHMKSHAMKYKCNVCRKKFKSKHGLVIHLKLHAGLEHYACELCSLTFESESSFSLHCETHEVTDDGEEDCEVEREEMCDMVVSREKTSWVSEQDTELHHYSVDADAEETNYCATECSSEVGDMEKADTTAVVKEMFSCSVCDKQFRKKNGLILHLKMHFGYRPFACDICSLNFRTASSLKVHKYEHRNDGSLTPDTRKTSMESGYNSHVLSIPEQDSYMFDKINITELADSSKRPDDLLNISQISYSPISKKLKTRKQEIEKVRMQGGDRSAVTDAGIQMTKNELEEELRKRNICPVCRKKCVKKSSFVLHLKSHPGIQPFACNICSMTFLSKNTLLQHREQYKHQSYKKGQNKGSNKTHTFSILPGTIPGSDEDIPRAICVQDDSPPAVDPTGMHTRNPEEDAALMKRNICPVCKKQCVKKSSFILHLKCHRGILPFECNICSNSFSSKLKLVQHQEKHKQLKLNKMENQYLHETSKTGSSVSGIQLTLKQNERVTHFQSYNAESPNRFADATVNAELCSKEETDLRKNNICPVCKKKCVKKNSFVLHLKSHPGINPYECKVCNMTFSSKVIMLQHKESHVNGKKPVSRIGLSNVVSHPSGNDRTQFSKQLIRTQFSKQLMIVSTSSSAEISDITDEEREPNSHLQSYSAEPNRSADATVNSEFCSKEETDLRKNNICPVCKKKCVKKNTFVLHLKSHPGINRYECIVCNMTFSSKVIMLQHKESHVNGKKPVSRIGLSNVVSHPSGNDRTQFSKQLIRTQFSKQLMIVSTNSSAENINITGEEREPNSHLQSYSAEPPNRSADATVNTKFCSKEETDLRKNNICPVCKKKCVKKNSFVLHLKSHPGINPYECIVCNMTFSSKVIMLQHKESHINGRQSVSRIGLSNLVNNPSGNDRTEFSKQLMIVSTSSSAENSDITDEEREPNSHLQSYSAEPPNRSADATVNSEFCSKKETDLRKNNICPVCKKKCVKKNSFVLHLKSHPGLNPYECIVCNMTFSSKVLMLQHKESHINGRQSVSGIGLSNLVNNSSGNDRTEFSKQLMIVSTSSSAENSEMTDEEREPNSRKQSLMCNICNVPFSTVKAFLDHQFKHKSEGMINTCPICGQKFNSRHSLAIHVGMKHNNNRPFSCEVCSKTFLSEKMFNFHQEQHKIGKQSHVCNICNLHFSGYMLLVKHSKEHEQQSTKCNICSKVLKSKYYLSRHIDTHFNVWDCPLCEVKEMRGGNFTRHMRGIHNISLSEIDSYKTFPSDITNEGDEVNSESRNSRDQVNGSVKNNEPVLTTIAATDTTNVEYTEMHFPNTRVSPQDSVSRYECRVCSKVMTYKKSFIRHLETHKNEEVMQQITDKPCESFPMANDQPENFTEKEENFAVQMHTEIISCITDEPELDKYMEGHSVHWKDSLQDQMTSQSHLECNICGKVMIYKKRFMTHLETHGSRGIALKSLYKEITFKSQQHAKHVSRKRSFSCTKCGRTFISLKSLITHKKTHRRNGSFKCGICGKNFKRKQLLESHVSKHEKDTFSGSCQTFLSGHELLKPLSSRKMSLDNISNSNEDGSHADSDAEMHADHESIMLDLNKKLVAPTTEPLEIQTLKQKVHHERNISSDGSGPADIEDAETLQDTGITRLTVLVGSDGERDDVDRCHTLDEAQDSQDSLSICKEMYVCPICNKSFSRYQKLVSHEKMHLEPLLYDCDRCAQSFQSKADYDTHQKIHQKSSTSFYECPICDKKIFHVANFTRHFVSHGVSLTSVNIQDFLVNGSSNKSKNSGEIETLTAFGITETENTTLEGNQGEMYSTSAALTLENNSLGSFLCNARTSSVGNNSHYVANTNFSSPKGDLKCLICCKTFADSAELSLHKKHHLQAARTCNMCGKVFSKKYKCINHMKKHRETDIKCKICTKRFIRRVDFESHMVNHGMIDKKDSMGNTLNEVRIEEAICASDKVGDAENQPASSNELEKDSLSGADVLQETISATKTSFNTSICDVSSSQLGKHACNICNRVYKSKYYLKTHMEVHSKYKPFKCRYCPKIAPSLSKLKRHVKTHSGIKSFSCKKCGFSFFNRYEVLRHIKRVHKDILPDPGKTADELIVKVSEYETQNMGDQAGLSDVRIESEALNVSSRTSENEYQSSVRCNALETKEINQNSGNQNDKVIYVNNTSNKCSKSEQKKFECSICQKQFSSQIFLNNHIITHSSSELLQCRLCSISLKSYFDWKKHIVDQHSVNQDSNCMEPCISEQTESVNMPSDDEKDRERSKAKNKCGICHKILPDIRSMRAHLHNHEVGADDLSCRQCGKEFTYKFTLQRHLEKAHGVDLRSQYNIAKRGSAGEKDRINKNEIHSKCASNFVVDKYDSVISCNDVHVNKLEKKNLKRHSPEYAHNGINEISRLHKRQVFVCQTCGKPCKGKYNFVDHLITHSSDRPYKCSLCTAAFKRNQNLKRHTRTVHSSDPDSNDSHQRIAGVDSTYKCPVCYKEFLYDSVLKSHMILHTGERNMADPGEEEVYECTVERNDEDDILEVEHDVDEINIGVQEEGITVEDIAIDIKEEIIDEDMEDDMEDIPSEDFQVYGSSFLEKEGSYSSHMPFSLGNTLLENTGRESGKNLQERFSRRSLISDDVESNENQTSEEIPGGKFAMIFPHKESQNNRSLNDVSSRPEENPAKMTDAENYTHKDSERRYTKKLVQSTKKTQAGVKKLSNDRKNVYCKICNVTFASSLLLLGHIRIHAGLVHYKCDVCGEITKSGASYKKHSTMHITEYIDCRYAVIAEIPSEEKPLPSSVPDFYRRTETLKNLFKNDRPLCIICGKVFRNEHQLNAHRHIHFRLLLRSCDSCGNCFSGTGAALAHRFQHLTINFEGTSEDLAVMNTDGVSVSEPQNKQLPYSCSLCSETFEFSETFEAHRLKH